MIYLSEKRNNIFLIPFFILLPLSVVNIALTFDSPLTGVTEGGTIYNGDYKNGKRHGKCVFYCRGILWDGVFRGRTIPEYLGAEAMKNMYISGCLTREGFTIIEIYDFSGNYVEGGLCKDESIIKR